MINTVERLRADIDSGRTADKIAASDPASAPLGADDEAAARVFGAAGHFRPRLSLNPMKRSGASVEDYQFAGLDVSCMEHLLASCGFLPEFAPVQIDGRLLGDGGLYANAPVEIVLNTWTQGPIFVVDLFASEGTRPASLEAALERKNDLIFGNQTLRFLNAYAKVVRPDAAPIVYLSYRPSEHEAGPEKTFDRSRATISDRWKAGMLDMEHALHRMTAGEGLPALMTIRRPC